MIINMFIVQYQMQFSGPLRNISNPCSVPLCIAKVHAFHALLLRHGRKQDIHNFT